MGTTWMHRESAGTSYAFIVFACEAQALLTEREIKSRVEGALNGGNGGNGREPEEPTHHGEAGLARREGPLQVA